MPVHTEREKKAATDDDDDANSIINNPIPMRVKPTIHMPVDPPQCNTCKVAGSTDFNFQCDNCRHLLKDPKTTVAELFAILRLWTAKVQNNINLIINQIFSRGANVNDRDGLTDLTLLHYACKAGAAGVGNEEIAVKVLSNLIIKGANVTSRCRWTNMTPLHYAAFFDSSAIIQELAKNLDISDINATCSEFNDSTALHIAANNLCKKAVVALLAHGADTSIKDKLHRLPLQSLPNVKNLNPQSEAATTAHEIEKLISDATSKEALSASRQIENKDQSKKNDYDQFAEITEKLNEIKKVRTASETESYNSSENLAIKIEKQSSLVDQNLDSDKSYSDTASRSSTAGSDITATSVRKKGYSDKIDRMHKSRHKSGDQKQSDATVKGKLLSRTSSRDSPSNYDFQIGDVVQCGSKIGKLAYLGKTEFADGIWAGIELNKATGKNDGTFDGITYFQCKPNHGVLVNVARIQKVVSKQAQPDDEVKQDQPHDEIKQDRFHDKIKQDPFQDEVKSKSSVVDRTTEHKATDYKTSLSDTSNTTAAEQQQKSPRTLHYDNASMSEILQLKKFESSKVKVGDKVIVSGSKNGIVRFVGRTKFASGTWIGVELDQATGKTDGSIAGVRYFTCKPRHGAFVPPSKVAKDLNYYYNVTLEREPNFETLPTDLEYSSVGTNMTSKVSEIHKNIEMVDSYDDFNKNTNLRDLDEPTTDTYKQSLTKKSEAKTILTANTDSKQESISSRLPSSLANSSSKQDKSIHVTPGMSAYVNNDMGIIRFIGPVENRRGTYIGIELYKTGGNMDGTVGGKKYFSCQANHGVLVKPSAVTIRGINAAELIDE